MARTVSLLELAMKLDQFAQQLRAATLVPRLEKTAKRICMNWQGEAQKRVPVDDGTLKASLVWRVDVVGHDVRGRVGSNIHYAPHIEFGTKWIAGGRVKALGTGPHITDAQAIKSWTALEERGGSGQQMPFLRPAWHEIRAWAMAEIAKDMKAFFEEIKDRKAA